MTKLFQIIAVALIATVAISNASPARLERLKPSKSRFLARQEVAEDVPAQTPYPPAGIKPETRFDLPTEEKLIAPDNKYLPPVGEPAQTYGPPAKTYGPPETSVKDEVEEVASNESVQPEQPQPQPQPEDSEAEEPQPEELQPEEPQPEESTEQQEEGDQSQKPEEEQQEEEDVATEAEDIEAEINRVEAEEGLLDAFPERLVLARGNGRKAAKLRSAKLQVAAPLRRQALTAQPIYLVNFNGQLYRLLK